MKRAAAGAALLAATVFLTGCALAQRSGAATEPAPKQAQNIPVKDPINPYVSKSLVEGTELICFTNGSYSATSCNWELWNKTREAAK